MLHPIVIVRKGGTGIVRWIYEDTLHLAGVFGFEGFQGEKVISEDELVVEEVIIGDAVHRVVTLGGVLDEDSWLEAGAGFFADPGEFEFLFIHAISFISDLKLLMWY